MIVIGAQAPIFYGLKMTTIIKYLLTGLSLVIIVFILTRLGVFSGKRPANIGVRAGKLAPCPESHNCVSTQAEDAEHAINPIAFSEPLEQVQDRMMTILNTIPRTKVIVNEPGYIYAEFKTAIMMYTDDVEFWFDEDAGLIHFRSASRLGYSDMGLNKRRMESIRHQYMQVE